MKYWIIYIVCMFIITPTLIGFEYHFLEQSFAAIDNNGASIKLVTFSTAFLVVGCIIGMNRKNWEAKEKDK